jgi:hypothetical protein
MTKTQETKREFRWIMKRLFGCPIGDGRVVVAAGAGGRRFLIDAAFSGAP